MATRKAVKKAPAKKAVKKAAKKVSAQKSAIKKATQKAIKAPTKKGAAGPVRQDKINKDLDEAIGKGNIKRVQALITQGVDANAKNMEGWTPLHYAAELGHIRICQLLIQAGADIRIKSNTYGQTALHLAVEFGHLECCKYLIQAGADIHAKNEDGSTPLHLAVEGPSTDICLHLIEAGADVNARDEAGQKPVDLLLEDEGELAELLRGSEKPVKKVPANKASGTKLGKSAQSELPTWNVQVSGTALVRGHFEIQAITKNEAWKLATDRINYDGLSMDELEFLEIRLEEEPDDVWEKS